MKIAIYARQSSGDEEESASVEQQIEICKEYAENQGFTIVNIFFDKNTSGKTYPNTAEAIALANVDSIYQKWLSDGGKRKDYRKGLGEIFSMFNQIDGVVFYDFTRLMRPLTDSFLESYIKQTILKNDIKLFSVKEGIIDFNTFSTNLVTSLESRINDNQIALSKAKAKAALLKLQDDGYRITGANFLGFSHAGRQKVSVVEDEIFIVKKVIELINKGVAYNQICKEINSLPQTKRIYEYNDLVKIANRLEYAGKCLNSKGEIIDSKVFPCIIPLADMLQAKNRINNKTIRNKDKALVHPLSGLIFCGGCGKLMKIISTKNRFKQNEKTYSYSCNNPFIEDGKTSICKGTMIREFYTEDDKNGIKQAVLPLLLPCIEDELKELQNNKEDIAEIQIQINRIEKLESILDKKLVDGDISESEYETRFSLYKKEKQTLKNKLINSGADNNKLIKELHDLALYISVFNDIKEVKYKQLAQKYLYRIEVFPEYIVVKMKNGIEVKIERIRMASARVLPTYSVVKEQNGRYTITYHYKTWREENAETKQIYSDKNMDILSIGRNPIPFEYLKKRNSRKRLAKIKRIFED